MPAFLLTTASSHIKPTSHDNPRSVRIVSCSIIGRRPTLNNVTIRHMMKADLATAVEIERQSNLVTFEVPGVGRCEALAPWAWAEHDFLSAVRQYRNRSKGTHDTRVLVALSTVTA
jgi:hypothetical protein